MTAAERANLGRKELLRQERFERFCQRTIALQRDAEARSKELLDARLRERRAPQLEFVI